MSRPIFMTMRIYVCGNEDCPIENHYYVGYFLPYTLGELSSGVGGIFMNLCMYPTMKFNDQFLSIFNI